ncbi:MAG TPA: glycine cleavage system aminomethyltransferase GcvT [Acidimicrobiales bacterium]|nr:glycine cleavage system aminomethyltransferase GcvT [Acidimicrobiales bacterium]
MAGTLRSGPLAEWHRSHGAKLVGFGGWEMPLEYGTGTVAEHLACRHTAAVFDVSHLGTVRCEGPGAYDRLQRAFCNDLGRIAPGRTQYTQLLDADGSVLDDIIVWWARPDRFDVMPNASNTERVRSAIGGVDATTDRAVLAVQGPAARDLLRRVFPQAAGVRRSHVQELQWEGTPVVVAGTGYTGEDGVECAIAPGPARRLLDALVLAGAVPAGLGARDTLRLEAALPLYGHELGPGTTPLDAGLGWVVAWDKPGGFAGLDGLRKQPPGGTKRLYGLVGDSRQPFRQGYLAEVGEHHAPLTSGNYSPVLQRGIGLCYLTNDIDPFADGAPPEVGVDARGRRISAQLCPLPFIERRRPTRAEAR